VKKNGTIESPGRGEESQCDGRVGGDHPFRRKLEIEECGNRGGSEIGDERIETEAARAGGVFFLRGKLRVNEEEDRMSGTTVIMRSLRKTPGAPAARFAKKMRAKAAVKAT